MRRGTGKLISLNSTSRFGSARNIARATLVGAIVISALALISLQRWIWRNNTVFDTTTSPANTYSVNLKGSKQRPWFLPASVSADVYKMEQPFVADIWLHTADDLFDLSFEAGFPDVRWSRNNVVEFYRAQYFNRGSDSLIVQNRASQSLKYLLVQSINKFLVFDIEPGASLSLNVPAPRGDFQWFSLEGAFHDGTRIQSNSKTFDRTSTQTVRHTYVLSILDSGSAIEVRAPEGR